MDTVVLTTTYNGVELFFKDFLKSIAEQTYKNFKLIILNDGMDNLNDYLNKCDLDYEILEIAHGLTPAAVRQIGVNYCLQINVKYIVFADSDDFFSYDRLKDAVTRLSEGYDIVLNNLYIVDENGKIINENYFAGLENKDITIYDEINGNYFGLSNTALRADILKELPEIPKYLKVVDWYIFSILTYYSNRIVYINSSITYYRQHSNNIVGARKLLNAEYVLMGMKVKLDNYEALYNYFKDKDINMSSTYLMKYNSTNELLSSISDNTDTMNKYINYISGIRNEINAWWSDIIIININSIL